MNQFMQNLFWKAIVALSLFAKISFADQICPLCGSITEFPKRFEYILSMNPPLTCRDVYFQLARMSISDPQCEPKQQEWSELCCSNEEPDPLFDIPTTGGNGQQGDEPTCRICGNDSYPGNPSAFIVARYVGEYSCGTLYHRGLNGLIPGFMCGPLQDYAYSTCGCEYGSPPTVPTRSPVPAPVASPTPAPIASPTTNTLPTILFERKVPPPGDKNELKLARRPVPFARGDQLRGRRNLGGEETPQDILEIM